eukprot:TRINITY_DN6940_c3_g1_i1.p1 TRINITY_DN6940_c3_g1~~TRINITY_DN6940_c3_g1_i1.p1  ORF type:complete len:1275 (+),score=277.80 TRINITY_DN6940_c3_g1_i1:43-3825(+)
MADKCRFSIDRGGTFTDVYAETPKGVRVTKLLSVDPANYESAPREGIRRILHETYGNAPIGSKVPVDKIDWIRMGTTVATNALLERNGERTALLITKGFRDLLRIGTQARPSIFDLSVKMPELLYSKVVEVEERVRLVRSNESDDPSFIVGRSDERVEVLQPPDEAVVRKELQNLYEEGYRSVAVVLMHSYTFDKHEEIVRKIAIEVGMKFVSVSSELMPMIKIVSRGLTTCVDAYLTPLIVKYIDDFKSGFENNLEGVSVSFMQSDGGLTDANRFYGFKAILSGPAGGAVGYAQTTWDDEIKKPVIGFDMGGTSTDVSRFGGTYEHVFETNLAGVTIQCPQLDITTVAAGGGSICSFEEELYRVGPESAGAHPGPVCYRKGGKLAVTDANLVLGRLIPDLFPKIFGPNEDLPLDSDASAAAFKEIATRVSKTEGGVEKSEAEIAIGFIKVANEAMCRPIRSLTEAKGYSTADHVLACFGGAGGQHACAIARSLGMETVFVHRHSGILSAVGIGLADTVVDEQQPAQKVFKDGDPSVEETLSALRSTVIDKLKSDNFTSEDISTEDYLNLRYVGTGTSMMVRRSPNDKQFSFTKEFEANYKREYGFTILNRDIILDDIRVRGVGKGISLSKEVIPKSTEKPKPMMIHKTYFEEGWRDTPVYRLENMGATDTVEGPAIIIQGGSTVLVEPLCTATVTDHGDIRIKVGVQSFKITKELDHISLSIFSHRFMSIAEQMGRALQRTAISTNIKERLDFSCALFGPDGGLVANAPHIPVHLGAMGAMVKMQKELLGDTWKEGDVVVTNHPAVGGSHLPDITVITPVFCDGKPVFYVACRGHHADIGGTTPGSIPPFSKRLVEEGAHIESFFLVKNGVFQESGIVEYLEAPGKIDLGPGEPAMNGSRCIADNLSDLHAQVAANQKGITLMGELIKQYSLEVVEAYMRYVQENAATAVKDMLIKVSKTEGTELTAVDHMDDGSEICLKVSIDPSVPTAVFDFEGTSPQVYANHNCPSAVVSSAIIYCLRCLVDKDIPLNQGCMQPIDVRIPKNSFLAPSEECAVVGGNVLTSQRVTDTVLQAFNACADSQGDTNNFTFGDENFGYYETICGGAGAGRTWEGTSGVHTHMTNTRITDAEILERRYPVLLSRFLLREKTGGRGKNPGGDGVLREIIFLKDLTASLLSERRAIPPHGRGGGGDAARGRNTLVRATDSSKQVFESTSTATELWKRRDEGTKFSFGAKNTTSVSRGDKLIIETPGGGGWGSC